MTQTCQQHCDGQEAREPFSSQRTVGSFCQGPPDIRGVAWWGNRHKSFYLNLSVIDQPVAAVATPVLVLRASSASSDSVHIPVTVTDIEAKFDIRTYWYNEQYVYLIIYLTHMWPRHYLLVALAWVFSKVDPSPSEEEKFIASNCFSI